MTLYVGGDCLYLIPNWLHQNCLEIWGCAVDLLLMSMEEEDFTLMHRITKKVRFIKH